MKRLTFLITILLFFASGKVFAQCVVAGGPVPAICQGGTSDPLGGAFNAPATSAKWSDGGAGGTFSNNNNSGATPDLVTYTASATASGNITLTLTGHGGACDGFTDTKQITVLVPTANAGSALADICKNGTTAALGGSVGGGATGGTWSTTSGGTFSPSATDLNATWTPDAGWTGTATLLLTTSGGSCGTATASKTAKVTSPATVNAGPAMTEICQGGTSDPLGGSVGGGATGGTWSTTSGGTFSPSASNLNATWKPDAGWTGTATLILTANGGACGDPTDSKSLTVNPGPTVNVGSALSAICQGVTTVALEGSVGGSAVTGIWSDGGSGGTFNGNGGTDPYNATYTPLSSASPVTLRLTTGGGSCGTTFATKQLTVNASPAAINQTPGVCEDTYGSGSATGVDLTQQNNSITSGAGNRTVNWYTDAGHTTPVGAPTNVTITGVKTYYVKVTNTVSGCINYATVTYTVNPKPVASGVQITGSIIQGSTVTASYTYVQGACSPEVLSKTEISWYMADNGSGLNQTWIATKAGIDKTYLLTSGLIGKYIKTGVKVSDGSLPIAGEVFSGWYGQVTAAVNNPPAASNLSITGTKKVGSVLSGHYTYSDNEGDIEGASVYQWYTGTSSGGANPNLIAGASSQFYQLTNNEFNKYIGFKVTPVAQSGTLSGTPVTTTVWYGTILNPPPTSSIPTVSGTKNVGDPLTGQYVYADAEGDPESGSHYQWYSSNTLSGTYSMIVDDTALTHIVKLTEQGNFFKFSVKPKTTNGTTTGLTYTSATGFGPANSKPVATPTGVSGTPVQVGTSLTANYSFYDANNDLQGTSHFRWFRDGEVIPGATAMTYTLTAADAGFTMSFEVTPVSITGFPDTGDPQTFAMPVAVSDPLGTKPIVSGVCIDGNRASFSVLTGKYTYTYAPKEEGNSYYQWYRDTTLASGAIAGANTINYTLQPSDLTHKIFFTVVPKSDNYTPVVGDTARSKPLARITMLKTNYVTTDRDTLLTAYPVGGYFWGTGVLNNNFSAKSVNYINSPFTVTYHIDDNSCGQDVVTYMYVNPISTVFENIKPFYCQNGKTDTIRVRNLPKNMDTYHVGYFDPLITFQVNQDSVLVIDPKLMQPANGQFLVYFWGYDKSSRYYQIEQPLVVESIQDETIDITDNSVYCNNDPVIKMHTVQTGGNFTGPVTGDSFDPSKGLGNAIIKYEYTSALGCKASASRNVRINPAPHVAFSVEDSCIKSSNSLTHFINYTKAGKLSAADSVAKYIWAINESGYTHYDSVFMTSDTIDRDDYYQYRSGGIHKIALLAKTLNGCATTTDKNIEFATKPIADFKWRNLCMHPSDSISFYDSTISDVKITSRSWDLQNGDSIRTTARFKYPQKVVGYMDIIYTVGTAYAGCTDSRRWKIYLRPTISLADSDYFQSFEKGRGSWVPNETDTIDRWSFGKPGRTVINGAFSGDSAWYVSNNPANFRLENTSIVSPCFDFTSVDRPMISMMLWTKFDKNRDGGILQYKIGDANSWNDVGTLEDGINWYNSTLIAGRPGGEQMTGWTQGTKLDKNWAASEHKLDELSGRKDVKFRLAYGSNGTSIDNEGYAFDDIRISKRTRRVLLEHFTNISSPDAKSATEDVTSLSNTWPKDIINIQYHTNFPGNDPYFDDSPADASARQLFYGLSRAPYTFVDGGFDKDQHAPLFDYVLADLDTNAVNRRSLIDPKFKISLEATLTAGVVSVKGSMKALMDVDVSNITLYLAVTQTNSTGPDYVKGTTQHFNVFRKFIPDAGGIALKRTWLAGDSLKIAEKTWVISNIPNAADIEVIAFLQNNITKEVYQAESVLKPDITVGISDVKVKGKGFAIYPNPASSKLVIDFENPLTSGAEIRIFDYSGTLVRTYTAGSGGSDYVIEDLGLKSGIYLIRISSGGIDYGFKKLIVSEK